MAKSNLPSSPERRDDVETSAPSDDSRTGFPFGSVLSVPVDGRCRVSSICQSVDTKAEKHEETAAASAEEEKEPPKDISSPLNNTRMNLEEERLDLNSVLSGTEKDTMQDDDEGGVSVKNLSRLFEENEDTRRKVNRPPLAPARNLKTEEGTATTKAEDDKRLAVFLRIRPPVSSAGKDGVEGSISTIEVIDEGTGLPDTIRTYPPPTSNAAKVVRGGNKLAPVKKKNASSSNSLNEEGSSDSENSDEVMGVKEYAYSGVFGMESKQSDIYETIAAPLVEGLFPEEKNGELGESALLFTLGVTNAGKTHTVMGTGFEKKSSSDKKNKQSEPHKDWGIIPRSLHHMLSRVNELNKAPSSGQKLQLYMSYLEIYNEQIYDLLPVKAKQTAGPKRPYIGPTSLKLRESRRGRIFVRGLARHPVDNVQQGLDLAMEAKNNRHTASNNINAASSRSHSICQFEIAYDRGMSGKAAEDADSNTASEYESDDDSSVSSAGSKKGRKSTIIWIVDLAGSERSKRTGALCHTRHQKEAALINASLMNLMRCLREMLNHQPKKRGNAKGAGVVPFRESKLTHMFMNHLTGPSASRTSMIVNVNPSADDFDETQHVLSYAATARNVKISAVDYNKKRRMLAKESNVKMSPVKKIADLVKKFSPQKRKGTAESKQPAAKRLRSNTNTASTSNQTKRPSGPVAKKKVAPARPASARSQRSGTTAEVEKLREENFSLKITIDELEQQLADCEAEVRAEVVAMMNETLQESKEWYEGRIDNLKQQLRHLQASVSRQANSDSDAQKRVDDLLESINECEEEMKRMREEHEEEMEEKGAELLNLTNIHDEELEQAVLEHENELQAEREEKAKLEEENGVLRHQNEELRASHDAILAKYNELLSRVNDQEGGSPYTGELTLPKFQSDEAASTGELASPNYKKLPRDRCSASAVASVDTKSPKKKGGKWGFLRSPAKVGLGQKSPNNSKSRSPLGDLN